MGPIYYLDVQKPCKRRIWSDEAVRDLISVCGNYAKIRDSPSTTGLCIVRRVYVDMQDVCKALHELGHNFTAEQCKAKKTNLINQYKQVCMLILPIFLCLYIIFLCQPWHDYRALNVLLHVVVFILQK